MFRSSRYRWKAEVTPLPGPYHAHVHPYPCTWHKILQLCLLPVSSRGSFLQGQTLGFSHPLYFLHTQTWIMGSVASQVTLISLVPNKELLVSGSSGNVRTDHPPHRCAGAIWGLLSGKEIYFTWAFCPWKSSLKSSPKSKRQLARWSDALPSETESQRSSAQSPQGLPFSPGEWWSASKEVLAQAKPT